MEENNAQLNNKEEELQTLRTYSSDMADAVRNNEMSVIKIAMAEQRKHEMEKVYEEEKSITPAKIILMIGGVILILSSVVGLYFMFQKKNANTVVEQTISKIDTLISYDDQSYIDTTNIASATDLTNALKLEINKPTKTDTIKSFFLTKNTNGVFGLIPLKDFLSLMNVTASPSLIRSFSDNYMVGTYTPASTAQGTQPANNKPSLFLIFAVKDYNLSYAGMLGWERTLLSDIFTLFQIDISGDNNYLLNQSWKDIIINNKDARVLYDKSGNALLYYIFIDKNNFVITDNQDTIREISSRLLLKNTKPL